MASPSMAGNDAARLPAEIVDKARSASVRALAERYGFKGRPSSTGEVVGPCPGCGGKDRFSLNARKNIWRCRQGGGDPIGGDPIALVIHCETVSFRRAVEIIAGAEAVTVRAFDNSAQLAEQNRYREDERRRAYAIWREAKPFPHGGAVSAYLAQRGLDPDLARMNGAHCREHASLPFWQPHSMPAARSGDRARIKWRVIHEGPAMLWPIVTAGHFLGLHATWLDAAAPKGKAEIFCPDTGEQLPAKKVRGSKKGGRIILRDAAAASDAVAVGEGIESVLSWFDMNRDFAGSLETAVDLGNLAGRAARTAPHPILKMKRRDDRMVAVRVPGPDPLEGEDQGLLYAPPIGVDHVTLLGDGDSDVIVTQAAMARAKTRLERQGATCLIDWPPAPHDFNSLLMHGRGLA